jgi:integration host factor subunit alpha
MSLTKKDIADQLASQLNLKQTQALTFVNHFFDEIKATLAQGEEVKLSGFGNFTLKEKTPRPGRNPKTGEEVLISARRVVTFKAGPKLKKTTQA